MKPSVRDTPSVGHPVKIIQSPSLRNKVPRFLREKASPTSAQMKTNQPTQTKPVCASGSSCHQEMDVLTLFRISWDRVRGAGSGNSRAPCTRRKRGPRDWATSGARTRESVSLHQHPTRLSLHGHLSIMWRSECDTLALSQWDREHFILVYNKHSMHNMAD